MTSLIPLKPLPPSSAARPLRSQWHDSAYALSVVAGLVLTPVLLTSRLVPRSLCVLGIAGRALLLAGAVCDLLGIADIGLARIPAGIVFLAPGGLFELCSRSC